MSGLDLAEVIHRVCLIVVVNNRVMSGTHQDEIRVSVAFFVCLVWIMTRTPVPCAFDVAYLAN